MIGPESRARGNGVAFAIGLSVGSIFYRERESRLDRHVMRHHVIAGSSKRSEAK